MTGVRVEAASFYGDHGPAGRTCEHSKMVDGRLVLVRYCGYCWSEYVETKAHRAYFCSPRVLEAERGVEQLDP